MALTAFIVRDQSTLLCLVFTLQIYLLCGTPLQNRNTEYSCPTGWFHYRKFCVIEGKGTSDEAVAIYCDGFGGIGIKGLCIIRAKTEFLEADPSRESYTNDNIVQRSSNLETSQKESTQLEKLKIAAARLQSGDQGVCEPGWTHYRSICVYKPRELTELCHKMGAVEFHGLCLKHADLDELQKRGQGPHSLLEKRICCCTHPLSRGNSYGC